MLLKLCNNISFDGGEGGIRTPGTRERTIDFESTALDHSATSPKRMGILKNCLQRCGKKYCKGQKMLVRTCNPYGLCKFPFMN